MQAYRAATMYYLQNQTMDAIAHELRVSRATVSRMVKLARESGLVKIEIKEPSTTSNDLARQLEDAFNIRVQVVPVSSETAVLQRVEQVARVAGPTLERMMEPGSVLGVAWGQTVSELVKHVRHAAVPDSVVVQLNGAGNAHRSGLPYAGSILNNLAEAFDAMAVPFPVPAFFDYANTRRAMWQERSVKNVLEAQSAANVAVFGVGSPRGPVPSHVYASGYLDHKDLAQLSAEHVVGDVCTVMLREDGTWSDIELNQRASGPTPAELRRIPQRLCVVAGLHKVRPLLGALRAGVATDLVVDGMAAKALLRLVQQAWSS